MGHPKILACAAYDRPLAFLREPGASKGTPGDAKCVTEILWVGKNKEVGGTKFKFGQLILRRIITRSSAIAGRPCDAKACKG